ncbi:MAG TPA: hypothetical protein VJK48_05010 [Chlamydiales bacterium]|nr:hypothetical protein [Chlamydiales bacterium]
MQQLLHKPVGVTAYETKMVSSLPKKLKGSLPTIEEIEAELSVIKPMGQVVAKNASREIKKKKR